VFQRFRGQRRAARPADDVGQPSGGQVEFSAYADDYTVSGEIVLAAGRLHELLERVDDLAIDKVTVRALDDGRQHELPSAVIRREELCAVVATGPRGDQHRRFRTRPYPMRAIVGPYAVIGYLHAAPSVDPQTIIHRRQIIAFSPAQIAFDLAGERVEEAHDALLVVRTKIEVLESASDEDVHLAKTVHVSPRADPRAKDLTG
jgi:hypothetical protein